MSLYRVVIRAPFPDPSVLQHPSDLWLFALLIPQPCTVWVAEPGRSREET